MSITAVEQRNKNLIKLSYGIPTDPDATALVSLTNNSTDSTPDNTVAAAGAATVATPTAYTAVLTGSAITVTTANAGDLTSTSAALKVLRDEVAALVVALDARLVIVDSNISDCAAKINEILTLI